ncbi:PQQ-dependent sugar dehydrogenase [Mycolicibacterium pulveris]|uniref:PQQ-dependent sugar dehydrogenase n=1 Tax=Mycolicibacterium pulveris TaxID=36813 RepID=UPI003CF4CC8E
MTAADHTDAQGPHAGVARSRNATRTAATGYAKYIGRVGALAVALGVAGVVAMPGVAWAEDTSSSASSASSASSPSSESSESAEPSDASSDPTDTEPPDAEEPAETTDDLDDEGVEDDADLEDPEDLEDTEDPEDLEDGEVGTIDDTDTDDTPADGEDDAAVAEPTPAPEVEPETDTVAQTAITEATETPAETADTSATRSSTDTETVALLSAAATPLAASANPFAGALPSLPTPDEVVGHIQAKVTECVCGVINGVTKLVSVVAGAINGGGGGAGSGGGAPSAPPIVAAVLEIARREVTRVIDALNRTPIGRFVNYVATQITDAITDFGNSPQGRAISAELTQFLAQCQDSTGLPAELERVAIVSGLSEPTDFDILADTDHPDQIHRIFITEKAGAIKVYDPATGNVTTLINLPTVTADGERGLMGIEIDPQFWDAGQPGYHTIYVAYTGADNYDRLSKLTLNDSFEVVGEPVELLRSTELGNNFHHGGELQFDPAGEHLYWAVGDNTESANAQDLTNIHGKILRLNRDGSAPEDNPFVGHPGAVEQIYAIGLRNPFRFTFTPDGQLLVGDVGESNWEELNIVTAGANYGWPAAEGYCTGNDCAYVDPIYAYRHSTPPANAGSITSVVVYTGSTFPEEYQNKVFIADYSVGWIKELTFDSEFTSLISERMFDNQAGTTVKLDQGPDGNIYQLNIYPGTLFVLRPSGGNRAPTAVLNASSTYTAEDSLEVQFSAGESTDPEGDNLSYEWNFGNGRTSTDANPTMVFTNTGADFTAYTVTLTVTDGDKTSTATQRIVVGSTPPVVEITDVPDKYNAGDTVSFSGIASDEQDGALPASAYKWSVVFHHADHVHPFRDNITGPTGSVTIPRTRDQLGNTFYRIALTVTDSSGLSTTVYKDINPNLVKLTFNASDPNATFTIDGIPYTGSYVEEQAVVGVERVLNAPSPQPGSGGQLVFVGWSDGGAQSHTIVTPEGDTTYTVTYEFVPSDAAVAV